MLRLRRKSRHKSKRRSKKLSKPLQKLLNQKRKNRQLILHLSPQSQRRKARNKNDPLEIVNFKTFKKQAWTTNHLIELMAIKLSFLIIIHSLLYHLLYFLYLLYRTYYRFLFILFSRLPLRSLPHQ